jgi:hypothetical protein
MSEPAARCRRRRSLDQDVVRTADRIGHIHVGHLLILGEEQGFHRWERRRGFGKGGKQREGEKRGTESRTAVEDWMDQAAARCQQQAVGQGGRCHRRRRSQRGVPFDRARSLAIRTPSAHGRDGDHVPPQARGGMGQRAGWIGSADAGSKRLVRAAIPMAAVRRGVPWPGTFFGHSYTRRLPPTDVMAITSLPKPEEEWVEG